MSKHNKKIQGYSFSYSMPYPNWQPTLQQVMVLNELAKMDIIEKDIQAMESYPEAEKLINRLINDQNNSTG